MTMLDEHSVDLPNANGISPKKVAPTAAPGQAGPVNSQLVVLVHGLGAPKFAMSALKWKLDKVGYTTKNWGYPSTRHQIEAHAELLADTLHSVSEDRSLTRIHLVTHSMGGILIRAALVKNSTSNSNMNRKNSNLDSKVCVICNRPFRWRKKWAKVWDSVKYCSDRCRRARQHTSSNA
jgi:hypothetical protein